MPRQWMGWQGTQDSQRFWTRGLEMLSAAQPDCLHLLERHHDGMRMKSSNRLGQKHITTAATAAAQSHLVWLDLVVKQPQPLGLSKPRVRDKEAAGRRFS
mmetsp:Transcript_62586/g.149295  ORF Transcript_62586/g.149295 Transcript_62586/m.149295 type:complete len:100 (+) Transcript_62586:1102-1401(+)